MNEKPVMSLSRLGRLAVVAMLFAWGTFSLWRLGTIGQFDIPGGLRAVLAIGPLLLLVAAYALIRGSKSARYWMYAFLISKLLESAFAVMVAPRMWLTALLAAALAVCATAFVHWLTRASDATPPPVRRTFREAGLLAAYFVAIVLCLVAMELLHGPQPFQNIRSTIVVE